MYKIYKYNQSWQISVPTWPITKSQIFFLEKITETNTELIGLKKVLLYYSGLENQDYGCGDPLRWPRDTHYPQMLALTSLQAAVPRSVSFACGLKPRSLVYYFITYQLNLHVTPKTFLWHHNASQLP
jgi:hypothetical protein